VELQSRYQYDHPMTRKPTGEKILWVAVFAGLAATGTYAIWLYIQIFSGSHASFGDESYGDIGLAALWLLGAVVGLAFYFVPTIIAAARGIPNALSVAVVNLFLGWTFLGWVVALAMAVSGIRTAANAATPPR
jgi:hypothetical protein